MITLDPDHVQPAREHWVVFATGRRLHALRSRQSLAVSETYCGRSATGLAPPNAVAEAGMPRCQCCSKRVGVAAGRGRPDLERLIRNAELARGMYRE